MAQTKRPSVLLADDDNLLREVLKSILRSGDYRILGEASNGQDAVEKYVLLKPDLVLLDILMPIMNGLQTLEAIHKLNPEAIVMMMSTVPTKDKVAEALSLGAAGFIVKPLVAASVLDRIEKCFRGKGWKL